MLVDNNNLDSKDPLGQLRNSESTAHSTPTTSAESPEPQPKQASRSSTMFGKRKKLVGGGAVLSILGMLFSVGTFFIQPFELVHFAELMRAFHSDTVESVTDLRNSVANLDNGRSYSGSYLQNRRIGIVNGTYLRGNTLYRRMVKDLEVDGIKLNQTHDGRGSHLASIEVDLTINEDMVREIERIDPNRIQIEGNTATIANSSELFSGSYKDRRVLSTVLKHGGVKGISGAVLRRNMVQRFDLSYKIFPSVRQKANRAAEGPLLSVEEWFRDKWKKPIDTNKQVFDGEKVRSAADDDYDPKVQSDKITGKLRGKLSNITNPTLIAAGVVALACTVDDIAEAVDVANVQNIYKASLAIGEGIVVAGEQIKTGDYAIEAAEELSKRLYGPSYIEEGDSSGGAAFFINPFDGKVYAQGSEDAEDESSWVEARSVRHWVGNGVPGVTMPENSTLANFNKNSVSGAFSILGGGEINEGYKATCSVVNQSILGIDVLDLIDGGMQLVTGGLMAVPKIAVSFASERAVEEFINRVLGVFIKNVVSGGPINEYAAGAFLGGIADQGEYFASNEQMISMGGAPISEESEAEILQASEEYRQYIASTASFKDRFFDLNNVNSVASRLAIASYPLGTNRSLASVRKDLPRYFGNVLGSFTSIFKTGQVGAYSNVPYDYGVPKYGFSIDEVTSEEYEDKYANVESLIKALESKVKQAISEREEKELQDCLDDDRTDCKRFSGEFHKLDGDDALNAITNNMSPTPYGYEPSKTDKKTGWQNSIFSRCFGVIAYDDRDLYLGNLFVQNDTPNDMVSEKDEDGKYRRESKNAFCDGEGKPPTFTLEADYDSNDWNGNDEIEIELSESDWQELYPKIRFYLFDTMLDTGNGCYYALDEETGELEETLANLCEELLYFEDLGNTKDRITNFAKPWAKSPTYTSGGLSKAASEFVCKNAPSASATDHNGNPLAEYGGKLFNPAIVPYIDYAVKNFGLTVTSGYRDPVHNASVNGAANSDHLSGNAVDFSLSGNVAEANKWFSSLGNGMWVDQHDRGSGDHLHVSFRGEMLQKAVEECNSGEDSMSGEAEGLGEG